MDETLSVIEVLNQIMEVESDDTSSNSSFKSIGLAEEEESLAEDQSDSGLYHDAETPEEADDEDYDQLYHPQKMLERRHGRKGYCPSRAPLRLYWSSPMWTENKEEENSSSFFHSDLGEVNPAMVVSSMTYVKFNCTQF